MNGTVSSRERRRVAFVRSLERHALGDEEYLAFAERYISDDPQVARAAAMLNGVSVWAMTGAGERCLNAVKQAYTSMYDARVPIASAYRHLDESLEEADRLLREAHKLAESHLNETPDLMSAELRNAVSQFMPEYLSALCYHVACHWGVQHLRTLANTSLNTTEDYLNAERSALRLINEVERLDAMPCWTIERSVETASQWMPHATGLLFKWSDVPLRSTVDANGMQLIAPCLAVATEPGANLVLCGDGNVVGTTPSDSLKLRAQGVHTTLPIDALSAPLGMRPDILRPLETLRAYYRDDAFCISPEDVASAFDRWMRVRGQGL